MLKRFVETYTIHVKQISFQSVKRVTNFIHIIDIWSIYVIIDKLVSGQSMVHRHKKDRRMDD